ncbi:MAG: PAS domain-containing protein [Proteobacteria bacterium]|nr:PAS domain-containing protein [Pseudomonadota bacterium]
MAEAPSQIASGWPEGGAEAYFRQLAEASQDCMWVLDRDGRIRFMNARARQLLDAPGHDPGSPDLAGAWPADSRASLERALREAAAGREQRFRAFCRDAGVYWDNLVSPVVGADGEVSELLVVSRDVTAAVETEAFLETVIQLLPAPLTVKDVHSRRYLLMNRAVEELMGIEGGEGIGKLAEDILPTDRATRIRDADEAVLREGRMTRLDNVVFPSADAPPRYFNFKVLATHDDAGPRHLVTIGDDVTERRAAAEKLQAALEAAEQASRAKSAFIANMSHEIRTPLNGIMASAELLAREPLSERGAELAGMVQASGRALERLMSDILDIVRADSGALALERETFDLGEVLAAAMDEIAPAAARKGLALDLAIEDGLGGAVIGDADRLRQVLGHLLGNAEKFTEQGAIRLDVARAPAEGAAGARIRFTVTDTGVGFEPALAERLFDRFYQADQSFTRRFDGPGLGLAICRELVTRMGGALGAEGRPGEGASFWFEAVLPAHSQADTPAAEPGAGPGGNLRILVADDHPTNRRVVQLMLAPVGDTVSVENGAEAVDAFRSARFHAVLMDMQMPVMDGLAAVREIRRIEAEAGMARTPIIMLTANAMAEHRQASAHAGADLHLGKPITADSLLSALSAALAADVADKAEAEQALTAETRR